MSTALKRCAWVTEDDTYRRYHDTEWGVPTWDDRRLFEFLILEGAQAGLSWLTVLKRREGYRKAFAGFDPVQVAVFSPDDVDRLMHEVSVIRHRGKLESAIQNAKVFNSIVSECGSFATYLWNFVGNTPITNHPRTLNEVPTSNTVSDEISKDLKRRGMSFVGTTIIYAYLQAVGVIIDHTTDCFRYNTIDGNTKNSHI